MLTVELRTMDLKEVLELWDTDKKKLKLKLQDDYDDLLEEYRKQIKIYTQASNKCSILSLKYLSFNKINYQIEIGTEERLRGNIKFTNDFTENTRILLKVAECKNYYNESTTAGDLAEIIRLKAYEIADVLKLLKVKINCGKDFESKRDEWLHEDLAEIRNFENEI
jgi:hypothetical protein